MITRRQALAVGSPSLILLAGTLLLNVWDQREQLLDRLVRLARLHD